MIFLGKAWLELLPVGSNWLSHFAGSTNEKSHCGISFLFIFLKSLSQESIEK